MARRKKTIGDYLLDIREIIGENCNHKEYGNYKYYSARDYVVVYLFKKNREVLEIGKYNVDDPRGETKVSFRLDEAAPTKKSLLDFIRKAKSMVKKNYEKN